MRGVVKSSNLRNRKTTAANTRNNGAPIISMAIVNLCLKQIEVAQARPHFIEKRGGRACVVGRDVSRNAAQPNKETTMKPFKLIGLAVVCILLYSHPLTAQKPKSPTADEIKKMQAMVAEDFLDALQSMKDYLIDKNDQDFQNAHSKFIAVDSLISFLEKGSKSKLDTSDLPKIKQAASQFKDFTLTKMTELAERGEKARFSFGGRTAILSKDGEAPLVVYLTIAKSFGDNLLSKMSNIFFSHTWKTGAGTFKMRACAYRSWQERFTEIGLGDKYKVVVINMTNKLGRDVSLNPMVDKFTILTSNGRQFHNSDVDFDDYSALERLPEENQQSVFTKVINIYDGADTPVIVLFPASVPDSENWARIIFDSAMGAFGESLSKGSLTKEK